MQIGNSKYKVSVSQLSKVAGVKAQPIEAQVINRSI